MPSDRKMIDGIEHVVYLHPFEPGKIVKEPLPDPDDEDDEK